MRLFVVLVLLLALCGVVIQIAHAAPKAAAPKKAAAAPALQLKAVAVSQKVGVSASTKAAPKAKKAALGKERLLNLLKARQLEKPYPQKMVEGLETVEVKQEETGDLLQQIRCQE